MKRGFTLVEILVSMTIIAILAALALGALQQSKEAARKARTRSLVMRLNRVIMEEYEMALEKKVPITTRTMDPIRRAIAIRNAKYDYQRMTCPDRWSDVLGNPIFMVPPITPAPYVPGRTLGMRNVYNNKKNDLLARGMSNIDAVNLLEKNGSAELLYLIVRMGPAADQFKEISIGDTDGDGLNEFVDAWGTPIRWIRWPSGFQQDPPLPDPPPSPRPPPRYRADATLIDPEQQDSIDRMRLIPDDFAITPLIYSAGPDKQYDISIGHDQNGETYAYRVVRYVLPSHMELNPSNPRAEMVIRTCTLDENPFTDSDPNTADWPDGKPIGLPWDGDDGEGGGPDGKDGWYDNITNHQQNRRTY